ncbi:MAG: hypothetical protein LBR87_05195, partial [Synergistaceae bacterium]|nr:hypothetical protein [Synergistaceae bacterium]
LEGVFYHNELDIASLAHLYCHVAEALDGNSPLARELLRAGDVWAGLGRQDRAGELWERASRDPEARTESLLRRARLAKKNKNYKDAAEYFSLAIRDVSSPGGMCASSVVLPVLEELAKLEEHRFRAPQRALGYVETALERLKRDRHYGRPLDVDMFRSMQRRRDRLERKIISGG